MTDLNALCIYSRSGYKRPRYIQHINRFIDKRNLHKSSSPLLNNSILNPYKKMGYVNDWKDAFSQSKRLNIIFFDLHSGEEFNKVIEKKYDIIFVLHSVTGDNFSDLVELEKYLCNRKGLLFLFVANEYLELDKKIEFINNIGADYIGTQFPLHIAKNFYKNIKATIIETPHGLNENIYFDKGKTRSIDIGFRGAKYPLFIGDSERNNFLELIKEKEKKFNLKNEIIVGDQGKLSRHEWSNKLNQYSGIVGAEAGSYFLDENGASLNKSKIYCENHEGVTIEELRDNIFKNQNFLSGKVISSRHFEAIGTKTCQILLEGDYNQILEADQDYIMVKKDFSNIDNAIEKFLDVDFRKNIVDDAFNKVITNHTYSQRVEFILDQININNL